MLNFFSVVPTIRMSTDSEFMEASRAADFFAAVTVNDKLARENSWIFDLARELGDINLAQNVNYVYESLWNFCVDNPAGRMCAIIYSDKESDFVSILKLCGLFQDLATENHDCAVQAFLRHENSG